MTEHAARPRFPVVQAAFALVAVAVIALNAWRYTSVGADQPEERQAAVIFGTLPVPVLIGLAAAIRLRYRRTPPAGRFDVARTTVRYSVGMVFLVPAVLCLVATAAAGYETVDALRANRLGGISGTVQLSHCEWIEGTQSCTGPFRSTDGTVTRARVDIDPGSAPNEGDTVAARLADRDSTRAWRPGNGWLGYLIAAVVLAGLGVLAGFLAAAYYRPVRVAAADTLDEPPV